MRSNGSVRRAVGRHGISPVLAVGMLSLMVVSMAAATFVFLERGQAGIEDQVDRLELRTLNVSCHRDRVTWWVNNTGPSSAETATADLFVTDENGLNTTLTNESVTVSGFTTSGDSGAATVGMAPGMRVGHDYSLELVVGDASLTATCTVGDPWWNAAWDHRRAVLFDPGNPAHTGDILANVTLPEEDLVAQGKLRPQCTDIRGVRNGAVIPYGIRGCDGAGNLTVVLNVTRTDPEAFGTYVYYGNLAAAAANTTIAVSEACHPLPEQAPNDVPPACDRYYVWAELGPEETVNLP